MSKVYVQLNVLDEGVINVLTTRMRLAADTTWIASLLYPRDIGMWSISLDTFKRVLVESGKDE